MRNIFEEETEYYYSYAEVDLARIRQNFFNLQAACDKKIIPVVKGDAWGQGIVPVTAMLFEKAGCDIAAVAQVIEGIKLREAGYKDQTIMLLSGVPFRAIPYVVKYNLLMELYDPKTVELLSEAVKMAGIKRFPIQIKVDTGLHRLGVRPEEFENLVKKIEAVGNLNIVGIMTHYSEGRKERIQRQYDIFEEIVYKFSNMGYEPEYISAGSSFNIEFPKDSVSTHLRAGWGYIAYADGVYEDYYGNRPSLSFRAFITNIIELKAGDIIGYSDIMLDRDIKAACISVGMCDGLYRPLVLNKGVLLIKGKYAHYIDAFMDQTVIDVTGIDCKIGDEVTIFGKDKYTDVFLGRKELADQADGNCSILENCLTDRVKRIYVDY